MINKVFLKLFGRSKFTFNKNKLIIRNEKSVKPTDLIINSGKLESLSFTIEKEIKDSNNLGNFNLILNYSENNEAKSEIIGIFKEEKFAINEKNRILASFYGRTMTVTKYIYVLFLSIIMINFTIDIFQYKVLQATFGNRTAVSMGSTGNAGYDTILQAREAQQAKNFNEAMAMIERNAEKLKSNGQNPEVLKQQLIEMQKRLPGGEAIVQNQQSGAAKPSTENKGTAESEAVLKMLGQ